MSNVTYSLRLPVSIKKAAQRLAKEDGVSLNRCIVSAVAQKVGVVETVTDFFKKRAGKATGAGLMKFPRTAPKAAPEPGAKIAIRSVLDTPMGHRVTLAQRERKLRHPVRTDHPALHRAR
jgi:hypothetical protein